MQLLRSSRRYIQGLGPYTSLLLLGAPLAIIEPLKLIAVFIFGSGHFLGGSIVMVSAYALSVLLVERLFKVVKPKLLMLPWFAVIWTWIIAARNKSIGWLRAKLDRGRVAVREDNRR